MSDRNFDLTSFKRANETMIATNNNAYNGMGWDFRKYNLTAIKEYTPEEMAKVISSGSLAEQQKLSRNYFYKDGYYKQIIIHYATLLKFVGLLIPNPAAGKNLSTNHIQKKYQSAMDYIEIMQLPTFLTNCAQKALVDGSYFGAKAQVDGKHFAVIDLPSGYCCSRFKDEIGNDLVEFDVRYFDTITDEKARKAALEAYPKVISDYYKKWKKTSSRLDSSWVILPSDIGICFPFFDGRPLFLSVIPKTLEYDEALENERDKTVEEIHKTIVQKIPHLNDGRLVFEPDEAAEMHQAAVDMMKKNKNVSVLTTYADVDAITSDGRNESTKTILEQIEKNIYAQAGVSSEIFASSGSSSLEVSLNNDMALMMYLANKFARFITSIINENFSSSNVTFKYTILPVSYYNQDKFTDSAFKLASSGYSLILPALALGMDQRDLSNIKDLENDVLKLREKLIPPESSYTSTGEDGSEGGRPTKSGTEKAETTVKTEKARENAEGGS